MVFIPHYFDLLPGNIPDSGAECLGNCFLHSKSGRQRFSPSSASRQFSLREDAVQEFISVTRNRISHTLDLNQVNACG
jgi:hypothetical protein